MKGFLIFLITYTFAFIVIAFAIWGEYKLLSTLINEDYWEWRMIIAGVTLVGLVWLNNEIMKILFSAPAAVRNTYCQRSDSDAQNDRFISKANNTANVSPIILKTLGGYSREQLNEIYLLGILIHQIYYSSVVNDFSERQQRKALDIQMSFFITVFPQRNNNEYFDFTEKFMIKNEFLRNYSITKCIDRSIGILSSCNTKQIRKLQSLYKALTDLYTEVGGGNKVALITFSSMLDNELSSLNVEDDMRSHYAKKKNY